MNNDPAFRTVLTSAGTGDLAAVRRYRAAGGNLHLDGEALLKAAVAGGHGDIVRFIHEDGGRLDACDTETVLTAMRRGFWPVLSYMFQCGFRVTTETMEAAAERLGRIDGPRPADRAVALAQAHLAASAQDATQADLPDAGPRWGTYAAWTRAVAPFFQAAGDVVAFAQNAVGHGGFESRLQGDAMRDYAEDMERRLAARFPQYAPQFASFTESSLSDRATTVTVGGRPVSAPLYANMTFFLEIASRIESCDSVCELGGGYGGPARLWLTNAIRRPTCYVVVDLPESLFFSEVFLRTEFGVEAIHYVEDATPLSREFAQRFAAVLCPPHRLDALRAIGFDLVYNTLSLQEMSDDYVDFYMRWLDRQPCQNFYSFNYAGQPFAAHPESANKGAPRLSALWHPLWVAEWPFGPSPAYHLLAEKRPEAAAADLHRSSLQIRHEHMGCPADPAAILALLSAARLAADPAVTFSIVDAVADSGPNLPREVVQLLELIGPDEHKVLSSAQASRLAEVAASLEGQAAQGSIAPHLQDLWRQYRPHRADGGRSSRPS